MGGNGRDINAEYVTAYLDEYRSLKRAGMDDRAEAVANELRRLGHEIRPKPVVGQKERAVEAPLATAVEGESPKRKGRPPKTA